VTALLASLAAAAVLGGLLLVAVGLRPVAVDELTGRPSSARAVRLRRRLTGSATDGPRTARRRLLLVLAVAGGMLGWLVTGLALMVLAVPVAVLGLPRLLRAPAGEARIDRLEALEEWTRNLAGVLAVGVGLEQAITASLRSAPSAIRPQVATLVARLSARWPTGAALRAFADELDDPTGDLIAASLILSAKRRGAGLVAVLEGLAASVAEDVRTRRAIEADRAKPRSTARAVTVITVAVLVLLALNRTYVEPYTNPLGQVLLAVLLGAYVGALLWMRQMTAGQPAPRFLAATAGPLASPAARIVPLTAAVSGTSAGAGPAGVRPPVQRSGQR
jgi:Flp pilus assembly protein TadB